MTSRTCNRSATSATLVSAMAESEPPIVSPLTVHAVDTVRSKGIFENFLVQS